ncbi:serine hydrolase domain-containing protein [Salininema proteolyticum]|uniref:Serine hydrolase domain-containing protein n=1 Tax=Salininema proteolyticum TaxID=1607685 RepID=A0ABV8TT64_9ACTN
MNTSPIRIAGAAVATAALLATAAPAQAAPETDEFASYVENVYESSGVPGLSAVVTKGDEIVYSGGHGRDSDGDPVTPDTPMRIASVSKSFTAMAVMILVEEGKIDLDGPVADQLPEFTMDDPRADDITVRQLLDQTSGLNEITIGMSDIADAATLEEFTAGLKHGELGSDPGAEWDYSDANYDIAARLVEVVSGQRFHDFMTAEVFQPLGMENSGVDDEAVDPKLGHNSWYGLWKARTEPYVTDDRGSGGVITSANDMGRWLATQNGGGTRLVGPESLETMHAPSDVEEYGMGWVVQDDGTLGHSGNLGTFNAYEWIDPETGYGVAVMSNGASLADVSWEAAQGLRQITEGEDAPDASSPFLMDIGLGLAAIASLALGATGVVRSGRWAAKRGGKSKWVTALRFVRILTPTALAVAYPAIVSLLSNGRDITWSSTFYHAFPLTVTLLVAGTAGAAVAAARLVRLVR